MNVPSGSCPICLAPLKQRRKPWLFHCQHCQFWSSLLWDEEKWQCKTSALDETHRVDALRDLRLQNYNSILDELATTRPLSGLRLCDVGCAYGWFLEEALRREIKAVGIEPESKIVQCARGAGAAVLEGTFPECLAPDNIFDILIFNDVLEHIPHPQRIIQACFAHLAPGGLLVINCPSSAGFFFKLSLALSQVGYNRPLERMWQRHFHSPHVSYFNRQNLTSLVCARGFDLLKSFDLPSLTLSGLWNRLRMDSSMSKPLAALIFGGLFALYPLIACLPADIIVQIYRRNDATPDAASPTV